MFKNILVPVDLVADKHQQALQVASELAQQSQGEITLLHVIEVMVGLSLEEERDFYQRLERKTQAQLDGLARLLEQRKIRCKTKVLYGNRAQEVMRFASESGATLIVLTAPRLDPARPAEGWGSLSYKVSLLSRCPVLLVK